MNYKVRISKLLFGLSVFPVGIALNIKADIGNAPWDAFHIGISNHVSLDVGTVGVVFGIIILTILAIFGEKIGLATILDALVVGMLLNITLKIVSTPDSTILRYAMFLCGMFIIAWGGYFYISSGFGAGPRDMLMLLLEKKTGWKIGWCRFTLEASATMIGFILGGKVGAGTVITVVAISYLVQFVFDLMNFDSSTLKQEPLKETIMNIFGKNNLEETIYEK